MSRGQQSAPLLKTANPILYARIDVKRTQQEENIDASTLRVSCKSAAKRVWWHCDKVSACGCQHKFRISVAMMLKNSVCRKCDRSGANNVDPCEHESLQAVRPDLWKHVHRTKNDMNMMKKLWPSSNRKIWWWHQCPSDSNCRHEFQQCVDAYVGEFICLVCTGYRPECEHLPKAKTINRRSLLKDHEVFAMLTKKDNPGVLIESLRQGSHKRLTWRCDQKHNWCACDHVFKKPVKRMIRGFNSKSKGCPYCSHHAKCCEKSWPVARTNAIRSDVRVHPTKNGTGYEKAKSHDVMWFECLKQSCRDTCSPHVWKTVLKDVMTMKSGCPFCGKTIGICLCRSVAMLNPSVAAELRDFTMEEAKHIASRSGKRYWFVCQVCDYEWQTSMSCRTDCRERATGCPECWRHSTQSRGMTEVVRYLEEEIKCDDVELEVRLEGLKRLRDLPIDASFTSPLSGNTIYVEYDGKQHFEPCFGSTPDRRLASYLEMVRHDRMKTAWLQENRCNLIRVPVTIGLDKIGKEIDRYIKMEAECSATTSNLIWWCGRENEYLDAWNEFVPFMSFDEGDLDTMREDPSLYTKLVKELREASPRVPKTKKKEKKKKRKNTTTIKSTTKNGKKRK